ncbi:hypothetical protein N657DRAFT_36335 [Parathielavia appendiculata]|uniref:Uncharacterized protein n=1 Tax=Parathielavia appendiculata TaxID=2587402 RepID=A0AAN6U916_9PEZI|nr:hypothetical protein N657DRAFT_36335 [Parathielavia appendiculata]
MMLVCYICGGRICRLPCSSYAHSVGSWWMLEFSWRDIFPLFSLSPLVSFHFFHIITSLSRSIHIMDGFTKSYDSRRRRKRTMTALGFHGSSTVLFILIWVAFRFFDDLVAFWAARQRYNQLPTWIWRAQHRLELGIKTKTTAMHER